ncbi:MAG: 30S ribosome-binding factor RbfA [Candidatus Delongbacteria bacterium]
MTGSKRIHRISSELKKALSKIIFKDLNIEKLKSASINHVKISPDLSVANIYYSSIRNDPDSIEETGKLLRHNNKQIRMKLQKYMSLRKMPELRFFYDDTLDNAYKIEELLNSVKKDKDE